MKKTLLLLALFVSVQSFAQSVLPPDEKGNKLRAFYNNLHVESLWLQGHHVNWQTGQPDDPNATTEIKTHCSAFAAAASYRLNVYMLRPPQHAQELLSNAQYLWFPSKQGQDSGWLAISDNNVFITAQNLANQGYVVAAVFGSSNSKKPGHIALVTPSTLSDSTLKAQGPNVIMAGQVNYTCTSLKWGFRYHVTQWPENVIKFYYNRKMVF
jgi:hypothetical protein